MDNRQKLADLDTEINRQRLRRDAYLDAAHFIEYDATEELIDRLLDLRTQFVTQHPELASFQPSEG